MSDGRPPIDAKVVGTSPPWARHVAADMNARYAQLWDDERYDEWIALFAADAVFDQRGRLYEGAEAIQAAIGRGNPARPVGRGVHIMANSLVTDATPSTVSAASDFQYVVWHGHTYETYAAGRTYTRYLRVPDGWSIQWRAVRFVGDERPSGW